MNEDLIPPASSPSSGAALPLAVAAAPMPASVARWFWLALAVLGALCVASLVLAWKAEQRGASLEQELVRRQQDSAGKA
ncbi:MAG: hypothetical protein ABI781_17870, partial [Burkholderiales bacterium]